MLEKPIILDATKIETELISFHWFKRSTNYEKISCCRIRTKPTVGFLRDVRRTEPYTLKSLCQHKILEQTHRVLVTNLQKNTTFKEHLITVRQTKKRRNQRWSYSKYRLV